MAWTAKLVALYAVTVLVSYLIGRYVTLDLLDAVLGRFSSWRRLRGGEWNRSNLFVAGGGTVPRWHHYPSEKEDD